MKRFRLRMTTGLVLLLAGAAGAGASTVELVDSPYTVSTQGQVSINTLNLTSAGTLTVTIADDLWPRPLATTSFELASATGVALDTASGFGTMTFQVTAPETIYALAFGQAAPIPGLDFGFGTYGLSISFQPSSVPLPGAMVLLVSALGLLGVGSRRRWATRTEGGISPDRASA